VTFANTRPAFRDWCRGEKTYSARDVQRSFATHGLRLAEIRSQPVPTLTTALKGQHITALIFRNHRDAEAAARKTREGGLFSTITIPRPTNVGAISVITKRNLVAIDIAANGSTTPSVRAVAAPGFMDAIDALP
jgi:hypothetical protein